jgi:hypothetical protein
MPKGKGYGNMSSNSSGQVDGGASSSGTGTKTPYSKTKPCDKAGLQKTTKTGVL